MASTKEFKDFILERFSGLDIVCKPMMGEYLLYYRGVLFGGIYDDRLLVKMTHTNSEYNLPHVLPYEKAKPMYVVENLEDREYLFTLITKTVDGLK